MSIDQFDEALSALAASFAAAEDEKEIEWPPENDYNVQCLELNRSIRENKGLVWSFKLKIIDGPFVNNEFPMRFRSWLSWEAGRVKGLAEMITNTTSSDDPKAVDQVLGGLVNCILKVRVTVDKNGYTRVNPISVFKEKAKPKTDETPS